MVARTTSGRRRRVVLGVLCVVIAGIALPALAGPPDRAPDRTIDKYVLFALEQINFKGDDRAGRSEIRGGNIGVNNTGYAERGEPRLTMCLGPADGLKVVMDPHTQVVADTAKLGGACDIWDVFVTKLEKSGHQPKANSINGGWYPAGAPEPLVTSLPPFPAFTCAPSKHVTFKNTTLAPGNYGNVGIDGSVQLGAGTYTFCDLHVERGANLGTASDTIIQIQGALRVPGGTIGSAQSCDAKIFVKADLPREQNGVAFGRGSEVFGQLWAPDADVALGHSTDLHGHFWAKSMSSDRGVNVTACGTTPETTTTSTTGASSSSSSSTSSSTSSTSTSSSTTTTTTAPDTTTTTTEESTTTTIEATTTTRRQVTTTTETSTPDH